MADLVRSWLDRLPNNRQPVPHPNTMSLPLLLQYYIILESMPFCILLIFVWVCMCMLNNCHRILPPVIFQTQKSELVLKDLKGPQGIQRCNENSWFAVISDSFAIWLFWVLYMNVSCLHLNVALVLGTFPQKECDQRLSSSSRGLF